MDSERVQADEAKLRQAKEMERLKLENKKLLEMKQNAKRKEQREDLELNEAYKARLAAQEAARLTALAKTYERQEKRVNLALLNVITPEEKARQDEQRAMLIQAEEAEKAERRSREKQERQKAADMAQAAALKAQQHERKKAMEAERVNAAKLDAAWAANVHAAEVEALKKQAAKESSDHAYRKQLAMQMAAEVEKKENTDKWSMDKIEMQLNAARLKKAGMHALLLRP